MLALAGVHGAEQRLHRRVLLQRLLERPLRRRVLGRGTGDGLDGRAGIELLADREQVVGDAADLRRLPVDEAGDLGSAELEVVPVDEGRLRQRDDVESRPEPDLQQRRHGIVGGSDLVDALERFHLLLSRREVRSRHTGARAGVGGEERLDGGFAEPEALRGATPQQGRGGSAVGREPEVPRGVLLDHIRDDVRRVAHAHLAGHVLGPEAAARLGAVADEPRRDQCVEIASGPSPSARRDARPGSRRRRRSRRSRRRPRRGPSPPAARRLRCRGSDAADRSSWRCCR